MKHMVITFSIVAFLGLAACAEQAERRQVNKEVASEAQPASPAALQRESEDLIDKGQFTDTQKTQLRSLRRDLIAQIKVLKSESLKVRALLLKEVIAKNGDKLEVSLLEDKMAENSKKRLQLLFNAVKKTNQILGRNSVEQDRLRIFDDIIMRQDQSGG